jgi:hypothetical protein
MLGLLYSELKTARIYAVRIRLDMPETKLITAAPALSEALLKKFSSWA